MNKKTLLLTALASLLSELPLKLFAYSFEEFGIYYNITSSTNMTVEVTYGNGYGKYEDPYVTIPNQVTHNGKTYYVTRIGNNAFSGCTAINRVDFNDYITSVGTYAFSGCNYMSSITIPEKVTSIGNYAFSGCLTLKTVVIEDSKQTLSLGYGSMNGQNYGLFADCPLTSFYWGRPLSYNTSYGYSPIARQIHLGDITIGPDVTTLSDYMFYGNTALSSITLPETVTALGNHAFDGFTGLTSFDIPDHITSIGEYAFARCTGLTSFTIPEQITSLSNGLFSGCTGLTSFTVPATVKSIGNYVFNGCTGLKEVTIEESEEWLPVGWNNYHYYNSDPEGRGLFFDCPLESVFIGRNLTYTADQDHGYSPFARIETLKSAKLGDPMKMLQDYLFKDCKAFTTITYTENCAPTQIDKYVFWGCTSLTEENLVFPESVTKIGEGAFRNCTALTGYTIPNHIVEVGNSVFMNCEKLANIIIKPSVKSIGNYAFNGCTALKEMTIEESEEWLSVGWNNYHYYNSDPDGRGLFFDCPLESVFIGRNLGYTVDQDHGYSPFARIETLQKARLGSPVVTVQENLFRNCKNFTQLNYNDNSALTGIDKYAFAGCTSLTEETFQIPSTLTTISNGAYNGCTSLTNFTIPGTVNTIGNFVFNGCTALETLTLEKGQETLSLGYNNYHQYNNDPIGKGMFYDCPLTEVTMKRTITYTGGTNYGYSPFANIKTMTKFEQGEGAARLGDYLLYNNRSVKTVEMAEGLTAIGNNAFALCDSITSLSLPQSLETIGNYAFDGCAMLTGLIFHPALKSIGNYAFRGCTAFNNFAFEESEETLALGNGNSTGEKTSLFGDCPLASVFIGRNLSYSYAPFSGINTLEEARFGNPVTRVPNYIFQGLASLTSVEFNNNCQLTAIGKYAFDGCSQLPLPEFPQTVTAFEEGAFKGCAAFEQFYMPETLQTIGDYAFSGCTGVTSLTLPAATTSIGNYAFSGCTGIKDIEIAESDGTLALGYGASRGKAYGLFNDSPLQSLYIGRTLSYTGNSANGYSPFYGQEALSEITVGTKVASLPYCIFYGTGIEELYVPSSVRSIHSSALNNCLNLKRVFILGATAPAGDTNNTMLYNSAEGSKFYVFFPDNYKSTKPWSSYTDRTEPIGTFSDDLTYNGETQRLKFETEFPILLSNMETESEAGTYDKRIEVAYSTNGYTITDNLSYKYTMKQAPIVVTVDDVERVYGDENPDFDITLNGMIDGEDASVLETQPRATTKATKTSDVGSYDITLSGAKAKNYTFTYQKGTLTVTKAPLYISTDDVSIAKGEKIPSFPIHYDGFRNNDTERVLTQKPVATTTATSTSQAGTYPITISGAEAKNYDPIYEEATLTIEEESGIASIRGGAYTGGGKLFNMQGQAVENPRKGLYIRNGKKIVVKKL